MHMASHAAPLADDSDNVDTFSSPVSPHSREQRLLLQITWLIETATAAAALLAAIVARGYLPWLHGDLNFATLLASAVLYLVARLYFALDQRRRPGSDYTAILRAIAFALAAEVGVLFMVRRLGGQVSRPTLVFFSLFLGLGWSACRKLVSAWLVNRGSLRPARLLIVGEPGRCRALAQKLASPSRSILEMIPDDGPSADAVAARLHRAIREESIDTVILTPNAERVGWSLSLLHQEVFRICAATGTRLQIHAEWLDEYSHVYLDRVASEPVLTYAFSPDVSWPLVIKRGVDAGLALLLLLSGLPLALLVALAIKLDSPGPVLFWQVRCGYRGRPFRICKFRSMVANAESLQPQLQGRNEMSGPVFKIARDPRITRVGRWLRATSLDEFPQFWNVLKGEMSLVGPRPPLPTEVACYGEHHLRRLSMKPGITGPWQVMGRNDIASFEKWAQLDAHYIRNWSLLFDLRILWRTFGVVCRMNGR